MLNRYPLWKYLLLITVLVLACIYASANLFSPDPAVQISGSSSATGLGQLQVDQITKALDDKGIAYKRIALGEKNIVVRLKEDEQQLLAKEEIKAHLGDDYIVALNRAATTPRWLNRLGAVPMKLGLDLSGGVHFLMQVDIDSVVAKRLESLPFMLKKQLRAEKVRYLSVGINEGNQLRAKFKTEEARDRALSIFRTELGRSSSTANLLSVARHDGGDGFYYIHGQITQGALAQLEDYAVEQNLVTLRNRVNELGVSEPVVQRQGRQRIIVELPGIQDTAEAKRIIGKTANLEFRLEATPNASVTSKELFPYKNEADQRITGGAYLERKIVIDGTHVSSAQASFDSQSGQPQVNITLDSAGGAKMHRNTRGSNVGRRLGVLFIEYKTRTRDEQGQLLKQPIQVIDKAIISLATIQTALNAEFRITGLDSPAEASELALLLRAGALAAPMTFVQESTIGPSLGKENIRLGMLSVQLGLLLVLLFMLFYYRLFGVAANIALLANLVLLTAIMSLFGATLTLPGIAGVVLTVGMAVDANVLIFSRIKEEIKNSLPAQSAINAGFERAFTTILDANITTFIVAIILYGIGTGPVKGFAVTLAIGILTSMFTAIMGTRAVVNLMYGGRSVKKLSI